MAAKQHYLYTSFSIAFSLCLPLAVFSFHQPVVAQSLAGPLATRQYDIPAQPLPEALRRFGRISGLQVVIDSRDHGALHSSALRGRYDAGEAIERLLRGTGLVAVRTGADVLTIKKASRALLMTDPLNVESGPEFSEDARFGGHYAVDASEIERRPGGDNNLVDQLRGHPTVQFSRIGRNAMRQGEISPGDISLHGTRSYQNLFRLDGMAINSDIDPIDPGNGTVIAYNAGDEQGAYVDSRLVERIEVLDSNISARYGGFSGGIVDAASRSWRGGQGGHVFFRMTDSGWNRTHVDRGLMLDSRNNNFAHPARYQPDYRKLEYGGWFETGLGANIGMVAGVSRRDSTIPMIDVGGIYFDVDENERLQRRRRDDAWKDQTRRSDNLNAKLTWHTSPENTLHWSLFRSNYRERMFQNGVAHSDYLRYHDALGSQLEWLGSAAHGQFSARLGWQALSDERDSGRDYLVSYTDYRDFNNVSSHTSGGIGGLSSYQKRVTLDVALAFDVWRVGRSQHQVNIGAGLGDTRARTRRARTFFNNSYQDYGQGDPMLRVDAFFAGQAGVGYRNGYLYAEDTIQWGRLGFRPGLRLERDDFVGRLNTAPRLAADWRLDDAGLHVLSAGVNRYYGRSMLTWSLYRAQNAGLKHCYYGCRPNTEDFGGTWVETPDYEGLEDLRTPYSDEWTLGWRASRGELQWQLQYVDRRHRDEIRSEPKYPRAGYPRSSIRKFVNDSSGMSRNVSLRLSHREPLNAWRGGSHRLSFALAWQKSRSDTALELGYTQLDLTRNLDRDRAWYKGKIINARDLPATDFNAPRKAALEWQAEWARAGLSMNHLVSWQAARARPFRYGSGVGYVTDPATGRLVARYDTARVAGSARWDTRLRWQPRMGRGVSLSLDIDNVLDSRNQSDVIGLGEGVYRVFEPGRQVRLALGFDF
ncbi:TonB-dependent receptor [Solilutibacter pythonis]|nr:TonB-dependent receptor [Lysobacter pythonis]